MSYTRNNFSKNKILTYSKYCFVLKSSENYYFTMEFSSHYSVWKSPNRKYITPIHDNFCVCILWTESNFNDVFNIQQGSPWASSGAVPTGTKYINRITRAPKTDVCEEDREEDVKTLSISQWLATRSLTTDVNITSHK